MKAAVLTVSDRCSQGLADDRSGPQIEERLRQAGWDVTVSLIVPDEEELIERTLMEWADHWQVDLILTTGGTGFSHRDVTPEATLQAMDRRAPGIAEALRAEGMKKTATACLSRGEAGLRGKTLIINLPGSPKAVQVGMDFLLPILLHALEMMAGKGH